MTAVNPYRTPSRALGLRPGVNIDKALHLAGELEDAELVSKRRGRVKVPLGGWLHA